ncbi:hypothetical protein DFAR_4040034 [Desulfarculales bacterium]
MGEKPPWRTGMDEDQKKRVASFRFGVIRATFLPRTAWGVANVRS